MSDYGLTSFTETGELTQVRNALTAVGRGETTVGIRARNGIVIAAEKKLPTILMDETSVHKVDNLCEYMGVGYSGIGPDFQAVLLKARKDIQVYHSRYRDRITPFMLCKQVADLFQEYSQAGGVRPFGIGMIVGGYDEELGPQIFQIEASGTFYCWKATALGRGSTEARTFLEKTYIDDIDINDAVHTAIKALKNSFEGEMTARNIEVGVIRDADPTKQFRQFSQEEIQDLLREVEQTESRKLIDLGQAYYDAYKPEEAIRYFQQAIDIGTGNDITKSTLHFNMANACFLAEEFEHAVNHYRQAIELDGSKPETHYNLGNALCKRDDFESAVEVYTRSLELDPNQQPAYYNLGNAHYMLERYAESVDAYKKAIEIKESSESHFNIAVALSDMGNLEEAVTHFQEAIKLDSNNVDTYVSLGTTLSNLRQLNEARQAFQAALDLEPDNHFAQEGIRELGEIHE